MSDKSSTNRIPHTGLPLAAATLTGIVALYIALVAFGNITDFGTNQEFVRHVLAMDTTFKDPDLMGRAITSQTWQDAAYLGIIAWETLAALVLIAATALWVQGLRRRDRLARARLVSTVGLLMLLLLFGAGFLAIGGEWFSMWQSKTWNGLEAATRNVTLAGIALLVVHLPGAAGRGSTEGAEGAEAGEAS
ncbi:membrane protein [Streptomyces libani subsp. rufus]|nr:membrane protein [Streptomyces libani subsp. rufus]